MRYGRLAHTVDMIWQGHIVGSVRQVLTAIAPTHIICLPPNSPPCFSAAWFLSFPNFSFYSHYRLLRILNMPAPIGLEIFKDEIVSYFYSDNTIENIYTILQTTYSIQTARRTIQRRL